MTPLYHITHVNNLPGILADGGLWCDRERSARGTSVVGIAHQHIKDRRAKREVKTLEGRHVAAGGTLADYVPFYFAPRSPMLYTIHRGNVEGYQGGQKDIVYLVTSVEAVVAQGRPWCFTEGHAEIGYTQYFDDLARLDQIDWPLMRAQMWGGEDERRRRRQAEFLLHHFFPLSCISCIGVMGIDARRQTEYFLQRAGVEMPVTPHPEWYY
jgi:hypothetical protein